jgi:excisionase family DNA binding protein
MNVPTQAPNEPMEPVAGPDLTISETAAALGVSSDTVRRRIRRGELGAVKDSQGRLRVRLAPGQGSGPGAVRSAETALLRDRVALLERERDTLVVSPEYGLGPGRTEWVQSARLKNRRGQLGTMLLNTESAPAEPRWGTRRGV